MKEIYEVKSNFLGDEYIDTKDGPAYLRHSLLGGDYLDMPPKKESSSGSKYSTPPPSATNYSSANYSSTKYSSSAPSSFTPDCNFSYKEYKRKLIPISSVILAVVLFILLAGNSSSDNTAYTISVLSNLIIILIPKEPILGNFLYKLFTATALMGAFGAFCLIVELADSLLIGAIAAIIYFIIFKVILSRKISD